MRSTIWCLFLLLLFAAALAGCGGGRSPSKPLSESPLKRVTIGAAAKTVLASGSAQFSVSPPLDSSEKAVCLLDDVAVEPCAIDEHSGEIQYEGLAPGLHELSVEIQEADGKQAARFDQLIDLVEPSVVVFAATPGGIAAAVAAARANQTVAVIEPTPWVGGVVSGGLTKTDTGARGHEIIGGIAAEFFQRTRDAELARGRCLKTCVGIYDFEPHVAEEVFEEMLAEAGVIVDRSVELFDVEKEGATIVALVTSRGDVPGTIFVDASYEGDLLALAGIEYRIGREQQLLADPPDDPVELALQEDDAGAHQYKLPYGTAVDPYVVPGDPSSGTLPFIEPRPMPIPPVGSADSRVMAYNYRLCVTDDPSNRIPFERPPDYDPSLYEAHARLAEAIAAKGVDLAEAALFAPRFTAYSADRAYYKYDLNGGSTFSTDMTAPDLNQSYVEATEEERERIRAAYRSYIQGLLYTWQTDPRFGPVNQKVAGFGYCKDEFVDDAGWSHQLYVRIARRMIGEYVMNENDIMQNGRRPPIADPIGFGAFSSDMHVYRYFAAPVNWPDGTRKDAIVIEGVLQQRLPNDNEPYPISYRALVPKAEDATNLLNPVTPSATQVAMASMRMEPQFMIMGEAAGTAAAIAIESGQRVQSVSYDELRRRLLQNGQRLTN